MSETSRNREKAAIKKTVALVVTVAIALIALVFVMSCVVAIKPGSVGVVYSISGGVKKEVLTQGWHFVDPTKKVTQYKITSQQMYLSRDSVEGSPNDESFDANCSDGIVNVDVEMTYSINADDVISVFNKYGGLSGEQIVNTYVRGKVKTYVKDITSKYTVIDVVMDKKMEVNAKLTEYLQEKLKIYGVTVESVNLSRTDPNSEVMQTITQRSNMAQQIELKKKEQESIKIEAENKKIAAEGEAAKKLIEAQNAAEIAKVEADAEAYANKVIAESITDNLIRKTEAEARMKHGWIVIDGAGNTIVNANDVVKSANSTSSATSTQSTATSGATE